MIARSQACPMITRLREPATLRRGLLAGVAWGLSAHDRPDGALRLAMRRHLHRRDCLARQRVDRDGHPRRRPACGFGRRGL